ncbi:caspase family protein [Chitiniphilus eburneus]|nr:caspase family protein [Chitiniphilus eburneus]
MIYAQDRGIAATVSLPATAQRQALVIGNSSYRIGVLANPVNDARLLADALRRTGFAVTLVENSDRPAMLAAIARFGDLLDKGGTGLFYYAGHGLQVRGENWLIPVDADIRREEDVLNHGVNIQVLLDRMHAAGNPLNMVFLDACRNNPYTRTTRALGGLARLDGGLGTLIAFSTAPGQISEDGDAHSPFAQALAQQMQVPGLSIEETLKRVRGEVRRQTHGKQITWDSSSLEGSFYFLPGALPAAISSEIDEDIRYWDSIRDTASRGEMQKYLQRYPQGRFAELAQLRLASRQVSAEGRKPASAKMTRAYFPNYQGAANVDDVERADAQMERTNALTQRWSELLVTPLQKLGALSNERTKAVNASSLSFLEKSRASTSNIHESTTLIQIVSNDLFAFHREVTELVQRKELDAADIRLEEGARRVAELEALTAKKQQQQQDALQ